jgi:hypothetical protein
MSLWKSMRQSVFGTSFAPSVATLTFAPGNVQAYSMLQRFSNATTANTFISQFVKDGTPHNNLSQTVLGANQPETGVTSIQFTLNSQSSGLVAFASAICVIDFFQ